MAGPIRELGVAVICTLSGEDLFLEKLPAPHYEEARRLLRQQVQPIHAFVSMNGYYANFMADYLSVSRDRIHVIPHGLNLDGHGTRAATNKGACTIGYLARIAPEKGLHLLVEAFERLMNDPEVPPIKLRVAGYLGELDRPYFETIRRRVQSWREPDRFEYLGEVNRSDKIAFLQSLDLFSLPTVYRESKGLPVLEALANAVPVVLPAHGAFPELVADTGGGVLHEPGNSAALAAEFKRLLLDRQRAVALGQAGQSVVRQRYHMAAMAARTAELYAGIVVPAASHP
jgi:glycosyltransferase involved in cell wall biosynthesis